MTHGKRTIKISFNNETEEPIFEQKFGKNVWYERLKYIGFDFAPLFCSIDEIEVLPHASRARAKAPILKTAEKTTLYESRNAIHP
jgi:hypothetical protein